MEWFESRAAAVVAGADEYPEARAVLAVHCTSVAVAERVCFKGEFSVLQLNDSGLFGEGIYLTLEAEYALKYSWGREEDDNTLVVAVVTCGNAYPVTDKSFSDNKPLKGAANSHIAVVTNDSEDDDSMDFWPPKSAEAWEQNKARGALYTEIVLRDGSQVHPLGYFLLQNR